MSINDKLVLSWIIIMVLLTLIWSKSDPRSLFDRIVYPGLWIVGFCGLLLRIWL